MKYISLLRGINVSGQKKIKMADLRALYEGLGFKKVTSYIQSGNVVFETRSTKANAIEQKIAKAIADSYGFEVPILVVQWQHIDYIIHHNPFVNQSDADPTKLLVALLKDKPKPELVEKTNEYSFSPDEFVIDDRYVFIHCPNGFGRSKINNNFFEHKLQVKATTRNWRTLNKLWEMGQ